MLAQILADVFFVPAEPYGGIESSYLRERVATERHVCADERVHVSDGRSRRVVAVEVDTYALEERRAGTALRFNGCEGIVMAEVSLCERIQLGHRYHTADGLGPLGRFVPCIEQTSTPVGRNDDVVIG